jgi:hypothetical protein
MKHTESEVIQIVQNHTGFPWFNGNAYVEYRGWYALGIECHNTVSDITDVIEWLREEKQFDKSDRLRTIRDRLQKSVDYVMPMGDE